MAQQHIFADVLSVNPEIPTEILTSRDYRALDDLEKAERAYADSALNASQAKHWIVTFGAPNNGLAYAYPTGAGDWLYGIIRRDGSHFRGRSENQKTA